jgi:ABC-type transporter Mla MlaB component
MMADTPTFRIERQRTDDGSSFKLVGRLEGPAIQKVERLLAGPSSDGSVVTLDLDGLESCDAAGLALLVALTKRAHVASGDLVLRRVSNDMREMFHAENATTKLHLVPQEVLDTRSPLRTRYLYRRGESAPFAAGSGAVLAHRSRESYFSPSTGEPIYSYRPADATNARQR